MRWTRSRRRVRNRVASRARRSPKAVVPIPVRDRLHRRRHVRTRYLGHARAPAASVLAPTPLTRAIGREGSLRPRRAPTDACAWQRFATLLRESSSRKEGLNPSSSHSAGEPCRRARLSLVREGGLASRRVPAVRALRDGEPREPKRETQPTGCVSRAQKGDSNLIEVTPNSEKSRGLADVSMSWRVFLFSVVWRDLPGSAASRQTFATRLEVSGDRASRTANGERAPRRARETDPAARRNRRRTEIAPRIRV